MTELECLVCGNEVPDFAKVLENRIKEQECVVCGSHIEDDPDVVTNSSVSGRRLEKARSALDQITKEVESAKEQLVEASKLYSENLQSLTQEQKKYTERESQIRDLIGRLPPEQAEVEDQKSETAILRRRINVLKAAQEKNREQFNKFISRTNTKIQAHSKAVKQAFKEYSTGFLVEECKLRWSPVKQKLGQLGEAVEYPAFRFSMSGSDFTQMIVRSGPEQVSESQRDFIDLAFRMALIKVAGGNDSGSLVIDAPESSLDAVFVEKAADVLARFSLQRDNRLIITSNLVAGELIPNLLKSSSKGSKWPQVVDLFEIAKPTAAIREFGKEYQRIRKRLLGKG